MCCGRCSARARGEYLILYLYHGMYEGIGNVLKSDVNSTRCLCGTGRCGSFVFLTVRVLFVCPCAFLDLLAQIITRKELNKRMISSAGTRKLYMMQLGDNT